MIENIRSGQLIEQDEIVNKIKNILEPIANNKVELSSIDGLHICLSGSFTFGAKSDVEIYITERGAVRDKSVTQKTNILIIGDSECAAFSNKNYGTKAKRAFELKNKGFDIKIITESEFFKQIQ